MRGWLGFSRNEFKTIIVFEADLKKRKKKFKFGVLTIEFKTVIKKQGEGSL